MTMDTTAAKPIEELDAQLVSTLREIDPHNYAYLFECCKRCNVNARQLRFFKKDQIHTLIPKSDLGIIAEFEYLLNQWQISKGYASFHTKMQLNRDNESNNIISPKDETQAQSILNIAKEKSLILSNNQPVVVAKQAIDIKPLLENLQGGQVSSSAMVVVEPDIKPLPENLQGGQVSSSPMVVVEPDIKPLLENLQGGQISSSAMVVDEPGELLTVLHSDKNSKISNVNRMTFDEDDDEEQFTLEEIIPELLKKLKDSYESKNSLSAKQRNLLCSSIVDYFESRKIKFSFDIRDELAEQIADHFPKEYKKSWCNRDGRNECGRFINRLYNLRRNRGKQTNNTSKVVTNSASSEDENSKISNPRYQFDEDDEEQFTLETIIPELLKELKDSYESKGFLSVNERSFLCISIVDYFESRKIKFSLYIMDELAEQIAKHFPKEDKKSWCNRDGRKTRGRLIFRLRSLRRNTAKQTNDTSTSKAATNFTSSEDEDDEEQFTLETIIPELLKDLKDSNESKNSLSTTERRLLCSSIVDYFESRKIKFRLDTMDELAEQIAEHFPKEDKKAWCNRDDRRTCGLFLNHLRYSRRKMAKQTNNTSTSKVEDDEEQFTLETIIPELLKELKDSYESKDFLSINERRLLCSSIVDYFESRKMKLRSYIMDEFSEQIVKHFPKEDKKSWYNRNGLDTRGYLSYRLRYTRLKMARETHNASTSKVDTTYTLNEDENSKIYNAKRMKFDEDDEEQSTLEKIIPKLLKKLKDSYESTNFLSEKQRRLLCSSIVDYFESRKIKFNSDKMDKLAEQIIEHFPTEDKKSWCNRDGRKTRGRLIHRLHGSHRNMAKQTNNISTLKVDTNSTSSEDENSKLSNAKPMKFDEEQFTLEEIIPELLKELKDSYESKGFLSLNERRLLCSSIVDYFESRKIKFRTDTMDKLAEQIAEHFPNEDKKSWCNRDGNGTRGHLLYHLRYSRKKIAKQNNNNTSTSNVVANSISSEDEDNEEQFTLEKIIPKLLKKLKDKYKSTNSLSTIERRLLCSSIVDYFESRKIKFGSYTMDKLAEQIVAHFPTEDKKSWCNRDGTDARGHLLSRLRYCRRKAAKQTNNTSTSKIATNSTSSEDEDDEEQFTLETIIPELLKDLKDSYESKNSLSIHESRLLCSSIVDYFVSRKMQFSSDTMDKLAEQIVEHFPTEDKKSWCNRDGPKTRGRFVFRFYNARKKMNKQTNNTSTSKVVAIPTSRQPESHKEVHDDEVAKSIQVSLKSHTDENFSEIIDLWKDSMKYRCWQMQNLKDLKSILEFVNNWPSYKLEAGHDLLTMDFKYLYPHAMETFRTRWLVYKENIEQFLKIALKDANCINLLENYQLHKATTNEDSSSCTLIYLVHAVTKPLRHFEAVSGNVSSAITDSQHSMMRLIRNKAEIEEYTEPYPCIFVVGDSMLEVQECYVVFMDLHYKLSYENCLAVCVQIFTVLKVEYPPASQCFWEFIRGYMFNMAKDEEKFNLATENMVNYLETVASSV